MRGLYQPTPAIKPPPKKLNLSFLRLLIPAAILGVLIWWLFFSSFFKVKEIMVEGEVSDVMRSKIESLRGRNIFFLKSHRVEEELVADQPKIEKIEILRGLPDTLKVKVSARQSGLVWQTGDNYYFIDESGVVYAKRASLPSDADLIIVRDVNNVEVNEGQAVVTDQFVNSIIEAKKRIPQMTKFKVKSFEVDESVNNFTVILDNGPKILMSSASDLDNQLSAIEQVLGKEPDKIKQHLDVRVEGKAYYQ